MGLPRVGCLRINFSALSRGADSVFQQLDGVLLPFRISLEFQNWCPGTAGLCPRPHSQSSGLSMAPLCFSLLPVGLRSSPRPGQCKPGLLAAFTPCPSFHLLAHGSRPRVFSIRTEENAGAAPVCVATGCYKLGSLLASEFLYIKSWLCFVPIYFCRSEVNESLAL